MLGQQRENTQRDSTENQRNSQAKRVKHSKMLEKKYTEKNTENYQKITKYMKKL